MLVLRPLFPLPFLPPPLSCIGGAEHAALRGGIIKKGLQSGRARTAPSSAEGNGDAAVAASEVLPVNCRRRAAEAHGGSSGVVASSGEAGE